MKKYTTKLIIIILLVISIIEIGIIEIGIILYKDRDNYEIDKYNFDQLEKAKIIFDNEPIDRYPLFGINKFNSKYNLDIKPIKNCYYISNGNKGDNFIFGFKLESLLYKALYFKKYYAYPKYDLPIRPLCTGLKSGKCVENIGYVEFSKTISNI